MTRSQISNTQRLCAIAVTLSGMLPIVAAAQPTQTEREIVSMLEGTIYVKPHRESADGAVTACGLEFSALGQDFSTRRGAPVKIIGSYYLRLHPTAGLGYSLKLAIYDGLGWDAPSAPYNAFVRAPRGPSSAQPLRSAAETPGYALFIGLIDAAATRTFESIVGDRKMVVGFNRAPRQQDVVLPIDLEVADMQVENGKAVRSKSTAMVEEFSDCMAELTKPTAR